MSKEDVLLFSCYGARGTGKSYYEKLKEKVIEIERLNNIINKAIKYIENDLSHATSNEKLHRKHILDILKGVDKDVSSKEI